MITDTLTVTVKGTDGQRVTSSSDESGTTRIAINTSIPASTSNQLVTIAWTAANAQSIYILSSQDCVLKTNSSGSPAQTVNLKAGIPLVWQASAAYYTNIFVTNITAWYITTTSATTVQAEILTT